MPVSCHPFSLALTRPPLNPPVHSSLTLLPRPFLLPPFLCFAPTSHLHPATPSPVRSTSQPPARTSWINKSGVESHVREFPPRSPWPPTPSMLWPETLSLRITVPPLCKLPPLIFSLSIVTCVILYSFLSGSLSLTLFFPLPPSHPNPTRYKADRPMGDTSRPEGRKVCSPTPSSLTLTPFAPPARDDIMR